MRQLFKNWEHVAINLYTGIVGFSQLRATEVRVRAGKLVAVTHAFRYSVRFVESDAGLFFSCVVKYSCYKKGQQKKHWIDKGDKNGTQTGESSETKNHVV